MDLDRYHAHRDRCPRTTGRIYGTATFAQLLVATISPLVPIRRCARVADEQDGRHRCLTSPPSSKRR